MDSIICLKDFFLSRVAVYIKGLHGIKCVLHILCQSNLNSFNLLLLLVIKIKIICHSDKKCQGDGV